jgi:hypothetical protein
VELRVPAAAKVTKPLRKDPKPRHLDGSAVWGLLKNRDPDKHYVYVNKGDAESFATYDAAGYEIETLTQMGVRPAGGKTGKLGEAIEVRGMVLMSISKDRFNEIEQFGVDGNSGQSEADRLEQMILDRRGFDPLRGQHQRYIQVFNQIEATENEVVTQ